MCQNRFMNKQTFDEKVEQVVDNVSIIIISLI